MSGKPPFLPYGRHLIEDDDIAAVEAVLRSDTLTCGPAVPAFEAALAAATGAAHAVACGNGTQALHLAALAAGLGPGMSAIVPAITFLATANAVRHAGADVVFADVDPDTGLITAETAAAAAVQAEKRLPGVPIRAVLPVHLAGQFGDLPRLAALARDRGWKIIEDACHALGTRYDLGNGASGTVCAGTVCAGTVGDGRWSDLSVFSFHPVKTVAMGEGGAITTGNAGLAQRMSRLRGHGMVRDIGAFQEPSQALAEDGTAHPWYYEMVELGFNYRVTDLQCALGISQLAKLERFSRRRRHLTALYDAELASLAPIVLPLARTPGLEPAWHLYGVRIDFATAGVSRDVVMQRMTAAGIGTQVHYIPVPRQPYYRRRYGACDLPGAETYYRKALSLPLHPRMTDDDVGRVGAALRRSLGA